MRMSKLNVSTSPHVRNRLTTGGVMYDVIIALVPATFVGIYRFGFHAFLVIASAIITAVLTEFIFDYVTKRGNTVKDGSAVVTGLLLALCLPAGVPLYIPFLGSLFAILVVKCCFGGLGHNFMNPALAGRCFLLISFASVMSDYVADGVSSATPLAELAAGNTVDIVQMFTGFSNGVIGCSTIALLIGGLYLWAVGGITLEIPLSIFISFAAFIAIFGGQGFDPAFILAHFAGGGIIMGAIFMATDPVTSPITSTGQILYGIFIGLLAGLFRVYGSTADSVSYCIIIANMLVPLIDKISVPVPYGNKKPKEKGEKKFPVAAIALFVITLIAGLALSGVYQLTKDQIDANQMAANVASYQEVVPDASSFEYDDTLTAAVEGLGEEVYGTDFGNTYINEVVVGTDSSGSVVGYVVSVSSMDGMEGEIAISVGFSTDGTVNAISYTVLNETAGLGSLCGEDDFKSQFEGVLTDAFVLNKNGGSTEDNEIDGVSGATVSSSASVNAVNAAISFFNEYISE